MKSAVIFLILLCTNLHFAGAVEGLVSNDNKKEVYAELSLSLQLTELCDIADPFCGIGIMVPSDVRIKLEPKETVTCDERECYKEVTYKGIWSKVKELDGARSIAIVTVHRYNISQKKDGKVVIVPFHNLKIEILSENNLDAKMELFLGDLKKINSMILEGSVREFGKKKYQASLYLDTYSSTQVPLSTPTPCGLDQDESDCDFGLTKSSPAEVNLIMGNLR